MGIGLHLGQLACRPHAASKPPSRRFASSFLQLHLAVTPCLRLRLPPSAPTSTLQLARISPYWAHWRTAPPCRAGPLAHRPRGGRLHSGHHSNAPATPPASSHQEFQTSPNPSGPAAATAPKSATKPTILTRFCQPPTRPPRKKSLKTKTRKDDSARQPPETARITDISAKICHSLPSCKENLYHHPTTPFTSTT